MVDTAFPPASVFPNGDTLFAGDSFKLASITFNNGATTNLSDLSSLTFISDSFDANGNWVDGYSYYFDNHLYLRDFQIGREEDSGTGPFDTVVILGNYIGLVSNRYGLQTTDILNVPIYPGWSNCQFNEMQHYPIVPLPIEILSFSGLTTQRSNSLSWQLNTERSAGEQAVLECSIDGQNYQPIFLFDAAAKPNGSYLHDNAFVNLQRERLFYRLKIQSAQGDASYSRVVKLELKSNGSLLIYPNPVTDKLAIDFGSEQQNALKVKIYDILGKEIYSGYLSGNRGTSLDVSSLQPGVYMLHLQSNGHLLKSQKFIKQ